MSLQTLSNSFQLIVLQTQANLDNLMMILLIPWVMLVISSVCKYVLLLGIMPRTMMGIPGILFSPLLHKDFNHLFFNSIPLVILSNFILMKGLPYFIDVTLIITLIGGFLTWCFAKKGLHIGASGLISGYWSFLIYESYLQFNVISVFLAAICIYYFAGILFAALPGKRGISWEGHLFGLLAGIAAHYVYLSA